jgi:uncharacterized protein (TIGR00369 family)
MEKQRSSRGCFLCGRENPIGLKVTWYTDQEAGQVTASVIVPGQFNSYPGIVHGGIVAALLDETAGRALVLQGDSDDVLMVTLKLEVKYRRAVPTGQPLTLRGQLQQHTAMRARATAQLLLPDGSLAAEAEALLVRPPAAMIESWKDEQPYWKVYDE